MPESGRVSVAAARALVAVGMVYVAGAAPLTAQADDARQKVDSAMAPLAWLAGEWHGRGSVQMPAGREEADVVERVESRLDGRVLVIEGIGRDAAAGTADARVVHHAFAILSYDPDAGQYVMRAFRDGRFVDAETRLEDGVFSWGFPVPGGRIRYYIRDDGGEWLETGEFSPDGANWRRFFEMRLKRVAAAH